MNKSLIEFAQKIQTDLPLTTDSANKLVDEAMGLYRQYRVQILENNEKNLFGNVRDQEKESIVINFKPTIKNSCSCSSEEPICRHQLALFFAAFDRYQSVTKWIERWNLASEQNELHHFSYSVDIEVELNNWIWFAEEAARRVLGRNGFGNYYGEYNFFSAFTREIQTRMPVDPGLENLYLIVSFYFGLKEIWLNEDPETVSTYYKSKSEYFLEYLESAVYSYAEAQIPENAEVVLKRLREETQLACFTNKDYLLQKWPVYCWFWSELFASSKERRAEIDRLQLVAKDVFTKPALMFLWTIENEPEQAISMLDELEDTSFPLLVAMMDMYIRNENHHFVRLIIEWVLETIQVEQVAQVKDQVISPVESFCGLVVLYVSGSQDFELGEKALKHFMPFSNEAYAELIFEQGEYRKWVDLVMVSPENIFYRYSDEIAFIAKETPEFLLPVYHFHVGLEIANKNRGSYKQAVKYMKKLRTIYKKLRRIPVWEQYLTHITLSNKRLRAFQSELERGKLIHHVEQPQ